MARQEVWRRNWEAKYTGSYLSPCTMYFRFYSQTLGSILAKNLIESPPRVGPKLSMLFITHTAQHRHNQLLMLPAATAIVTWKLLSIRLSGPPLRPAATWSAGETCSHRIVGNAIVPQTLCSIQLSVCHHLIVIRHMEAHAIHLWWHAGIPLLRRVLDCPSAEQRRFNSSCYFVSLRLKFKIIIISLLETHKM